MTIEELCIYLSNLGMEELDRFYRELDRDLAVRGLDGGEEMDEEARSEMLSSYMRNTKVKDSPHILQFVVSIRDTLNTAILE